MPTFLSKPNPRLSATPGRIAAIVVAGLALAGCGQKGPLRLPETAAAPAPAKPTDQAKPQAAAVPAKP